MSVFIRRLPQRSIDRCRQLAGELFLHSIVRYSHQWDSGKAYSTSSLGSRIALLDVANMKGSPLRPQEEPVPVWLAAPCAALVRSRHAGVRPCNGPPWATSAFLKEIRSELASPLLRASR